MSEHQHQAASHLRAWAEIDLSALLHNVGVARRHAGAEAALMAVVKADAYGHGLVPVARQLAGEVPWFGVANVQEAVIVAEHAPGDVFILGPVLPHEYPYVARDRFVVALSSLEEAEAMNRLGRTVRAHLAVDTGMGRIGCLEEEAPAIASAIAALPHVRLEGLYTHFPSADEDAAFTESQIQSTANLVRALPDIGLVHLSNSAGLLGFAGLQPFAGLVRPGLMLYGVSPLPEHQAELRPVLSLRSRVALVRHLPAGRGISYGRTFTTTRPTTVATIGIGYGDGYPRHLSNGGAEVLIGGRRCPVLGRVTMDQILVDVTHLDPPPAPETEVVLIGTDGGETILATELAARSGTIPWEILTGLTARVGRVYLPHR